MSGCALDASLFRSGNRGAAMTAPEVEQRLAAILAADVAGVPERASE